MPNETKRIGPYPLVRRAEPIDIDAQISALKQFQKLPGFLADKHTEKRLSGQMTLNADSRLTEKSQKLNRLSRFARIWNNIRRFFLRH